MSLQRKLTSFNQWKECLETPTIETSRKTSRVDDNKYDQYPYSKQSSSIRCTTTKLSTNREPTSSKQISSRSKELDNEIYKENPLSLDDEENVPNVRTLNGEYSHQSNKYSRKIENSQLLQSKKFHRMDSFFKNDDKKLEDKETTSNSSGRNYRSPLGIIITNSSDAPAVQSKSFPTKEAEESNSNNSVLESQKKMNQIEKNVSDKMKTVYEYNQEKKDLEKISDTEVVLRVVELNSSLGVRGKSEGEHKNIGVTTDPLKNAVSCLEENCYCCKRLCRAEIDENKNKIRCKSIKLNICKCNCGDDNVNPTTCCCPINVQFQNIFYGKEHSNENV